MCLCRCLFLDHNSATLLLLINFLVQQRHDCLYSDSKRGKLESATSVCPPFTTAIVEPHATVTHSHVRTHGMCRMNEFFFSACIAWLQRQRIRGEACVCERVWMEISVGCVCEWGRGPLVLSDRRIRSEGMYLSLSDSLCLFSPPAQPLTQATLLATGEYQAEGKDCGLNP